MSETVRIELSRADAERMERFFREAALFRKLLGEGNAGIPECRRFSEMFKAALAAAPDAPGEGVDEAAFETCFADAERVLLRLAAFPNALFEQYSGRFEAMFDRMDAAMQAAGAGEETR